jgi:cytochrome o ubiquinol oxidase operon protein cyoD
MSEELSLKEIQKEWHGTFKSYKIGFFSSLVLTSISFCLVLTNIISNYILFVTISLLALAQAIIQLRFFLHVGEEPKPQWESISFYFMVGILLIIVLGTLWIMHDLDERMM